MSDAVRAHVEYDWMRHGVKAVLAQTGRLRVWPETAYPAHVVYDAVSGEEPVIPEGRTQWLQMDEDEARALYEALADYFGGAGHDTRALRRDYDDERKRVDQLTEAIVASAARDHTFVIAPEAVHRA